MAWQKAEAGSDKSFDFEKNPVVFGYIRDRQENQGEYGSTVYELMLVDQNGFDLEPIRFFTNNVLDDRLKFYPVEIKRGEYCLVKIVYLGQKRGKTGRMYKNFDVFADKDWRKQVPINGDLVPQYVELPSTKQKDNGNDNQGLNTYQPQQPGYNPQQQYQQQPQQQQARPAPLFVIDANKMLRHPTTGQFVDAFGRLSVAPVFATPQQISESEVPPF